MKRNMNDCNERNNNYKDLKVHTNLFNNQIHDSINNNDQKVKYLKSWH